KAFEVGPNNETMVNYLINAFNGFNLTSVKNSIVKSSKNFEINNITAIMFCGEEYFIRGQFDYALSYFKNEDTKGGHINLEKLSKILEIEFNNVFTLYNTDINFKRQQFNKTILDLDITINSKPDNIEKLILRGKAYFFLEKYDLALFDFIKA
ncbi:4213_t:CDS:2, partial [Gigaspora margarita]